MGEIAEVLVVPNVAPLPEAPDLRIRGGKVTRKPTHVETRALIARAQAGDIESRNLLVVANQALIMYVVRRYRVAPDLMSDMWAEGSFGLMRAIDLFDLSLDVRFSTYAVQWIRARIGRMLEGDRKGFTAPDKYGFIRLDALLAGTEDDISSVTPDDKVPTPEAFLAKSETASQVREAVELFWNDYLRDRFTHKQDYLGLVNPDVVRAVIDQRMLTEEPVILGSIGDHFGLSREAVRIIQLRIEAHLRKRLAGLYQSVMGDDNLPVVSDTTDK